MDFSADHFALFGLSRAFRIDSQMLEQRYRDLQTQVHPDRHAAGSDSDRRLSLQWATRVNEAAQTLRAPLTRAQYLLKLAVPDLGTDRQSALPTDFLVEQMEWREAVAEARAVGDHHELEHLHHRLQHEIEQRYTEVAALLDDTHDYPLAADRVQRLMFIDKLLAEIDDGIAACDS
ncbi:MAG TPA: Fe-S protein assembly co-chaperone HscB [Accumulibacter sp.]|nr:Fe-S protein assembly co-chaperone HscB [Accumulibacter sp.]HPP46683.1 Fe-S protein assembly co-chaperone HscB [Accumulibacter sp.]